MVEYVAWFSTPTFGVGRAMSETANTVKAKLVWKIRDELEEKLRTDIPTTDPARVTKVVVGKYSDDIAGIILIVHADHPLGFGSGRLDEQSGGRVQFSDDTINRAWRLPPESLGGSRFEDELITVEVRMLKDNVSPSRSVAIVDEVKVRIRTAIETMTTLVGTVDDYGNIVFALEASKRYGYASGGGETSVNTFWCDFTARISYRRR